MTIRYDDKGKYFTEVIRKTPIPSIIQTQNYRIIGNIHASPDHRLIDELNTSPPFIAITDARVIGTKGEIETPFLVINKSQIEWIHPEDQPGGEDDA